MFYRDYPDISVTGDQRELRRDSQVSDAPIYDERGDTMHHLRALHSAPEGGGDRTQRPIPAVI